MHQVLQFNQSQWLKPYIEFNAKKNRGRKNNDSDGKALHKLMNNDVYRATMENERNRVNVKHVINKKDEKNKLYIAQNI